MNRWSNGTHFRKPFCVAERPELKQGSAQRLACTHLPKRGGRIVFESNRRPTRTLNGRSPPGRTGRRFPSSGSGSGS